MIFELPLSWCVVDCDGSACGSGNVGRHTHQPQHHCIPVWAGPIPAARARVEQGNVTYSAVGHATA